MNVIKISLIVIFFLTALNIKAEDLPYPKLKYEPVTESAQYQFNGKLKETSLKNTEIINKIKLVKEAEISRDKKKSIPLGVIMSAVIPGTGQIYAQSYIKAGIFLALEAASWIYYLSYNNKGDEQVEFYQGFADQNWDVRRYARWLVSNNFNESGVINPDEQDLEILRQQINICESANFSHTLPPYRSQQYYELIGKYQNFMGGWIDAGYINKSNFQTERTPLFNYYSVERQKANDFYNRAKVGSFAAIINHVLSAADAAWSVSKYNNSVKVQTSLRVDPEYNNYTEKYSLIPRLNLKVSF